MTEANRVELVARDTILKLLSDDEVAKVSTAEAASALAVGEEYLDLEQLDKGVQRAGSALNVTMGHILPRAGVRDETWSKIVAQLGA